MAHEACHAVQLYGSTRRFDAAILICLQNGFMIQLIMAQHSMTSTAEVHVVVYMDWSSFLPQDTYTTPASTYPKLQCLIPRKIDFSLSPKHVFSIISCTQEGVLEGTASGMEADLSRNIDHT